MLLLSIKRHNDESHWNYHEKLIWTTRIWCRYWTQHTYKYCNWTPNSGCCMVLPKLSAYTADKIRVNRGSYSTESKWYGTENSMKINLTHFRRNQCSHNRIVQDVFPWGNTSHGVSSAFDQSEPTDLGLEPLKFHDIIAYLIMSLYLPCPG